MGATVCDYASRIAAGVRRRARRLNLESSVLEVEVSQQPSFDVDADLALPAQADNGGAVGVEELTTEPLVRLRLLFDRLLWPVPPLRCAHPARSPLRACVRVNLRAPSGWFRARRLNR